MRHEDMRVVRASFRQLLLLQLIAPRFTDKPRRLSYVLGDGR
jgi:hypothetical protein